MAVAHLPHVFACQGLSPVQQRPTVTNTALSDHDIHLVPIQFVPILHSE
jgi:hypothetical protein